MLSWLYQRIGLVKDGLANTADPNLYWDNTRQIQYEGSKMNTTLLAVLLPTFPLGYVVEQLARKPEFKDWTPQRFEEVETEYRKFLALSKLHSGMNLIPSYEVDEFWHRHMLNSRRYMPDCQEYFGHYLHHTPFAGTPNKELFLQQHNATMRLYIEAFGNPPKSWAARANCCEGQGGGCYGGTGDN